MPSDLVFLDSGGWIALLNERDENHPQATTVWGQIVKRRPTVITTSWVIAETGNGLSATPVRVKFARAVRFLLTRPDYRVIEVDRGLLEKATDLYASRLDKTWGLVDCASFVVMEELNISEAFTTDHDFTQAGFQRLIPRPRGSNGR